MAVSEKLLNQIYKNGDLLVVPQVNPKKLTQAKLYPSVMIAVKERKGNVAFAELPSMVNVHLQAICSDEDCQLALNSLANKFTHENLERKNKNLSPTSLQSLYQSAHANVYSAIPDKNKCEGYILAEYNELIKGAERLSGYNELIFPRLKLFNESGPACYEIETAIRANAIEGQSASFIAQSTVKQPDILVSYGDNELAYLECKKKDVYIAKPISAHWEKLARSTAEDLTSIKKQAMVSVIIPDELEEDAIDPIHDFIIKLAQDDFRGEVLLPNNYGAVILEDVNENLPASAPSGAVGVSFPNDESTVSTAISMLAQYDKNTGVSNAKDKNVVVIYRYLSHKIKNIIQTFDHARKQLPEDSTGIIYIDVDTTSIKNIDISIKYLRLLGIVVNSLFNPSKNTRVKAVVFTSGPIPIAKSKFNFKIPLTSEIALCRLYSKCENPFNPLPKDLVLPGDKQISFTRRIIPFAKKWTVQPF